jgi:hypothetical protein
MKRLQVRYHAQPDDVIAVGELAEEGRQFFFEYSVCGEGRAPDLSHIRRVAAGAGLDAPAVEQVLNEVRDAVSRWMSFARTHEVRKSTRERIQKHLCLLTDG